MASEVLLSNMIPFAGSGLVGYAIGFALKKILKWTGEQGRIDKEMLSKHLSSDEVNHAIFYVCGPPAMLNAMKSILEDKLKITKERIKVEEFTGY